MTIDPQRLTEGYNAALAAVGLSPCAAGSVRYVNAVKAAFAVLQPHIEAQALRGAADAAERVTMVHDQDSDDGWRAWMRARADHIEAAARTSGENQPATFDVIKASRGENPWGGPPQGPCQPIGCDNGYHLPNCAFAPVDENRGD